MTGRTVLYLAAVSIFIWLVSCTDSRPSAEAPADSFGAPSDRQIDGWYFGYSEVPAGRIGWLLQLDIRTASGKIYLPPQILTLKNLVITPDGEVSFQFEDNNQVTFEGNLKDGVITGKFSYSEGSSFKTRLTRVEEKSFTQEYAVFAGLYSNVKFVEQAGDLVGAEILLIPQANGLGGIFTLYEGVPGNIYSLTNVQIKNRTISFAIVTNNGVQNFIGQLSSDRIIVNRVGSERPEPEPITLPKRKDFVESLSSGNTTVP